MIYTICSTMRAGTHLLSDLLSQAGLGNPGEYMQPQAGWSPEDYAEKIAKANAGQQHCGHVVLWGQLTEMSRHHPGEFLDATLAALQDMRDAATGGYDALQTDGGPHFVYLYRRDTLAQVASAVKARQTKQWHAHSQQAVKHPKDLKYEREDWDTLYDQFTRANFRWKMYFKKRGLLSGAFEYGAFKAFPSEGVLTYESLARAPQLTMKRVATHLGQFLSDSVLELKPRYVKMAGEENARLIEDFLEDHPTWRHRQTE